jgi:glycosyltransferase involved in cell wall biosynthesis
MRVLWLAHAIPYPPKAGFLNRSYHLLRELARSHEVDVFALVQERWVRTLFPSLEEGLAESREVLTSFCRKVTFAPITKLQRRLGKERTAIEALLAGQSYATTWLDSTSARSILTASTARSECQLVHVDTIGLVPFLDVLPRIPATLGHHNVESHMLARRAQNTRNPLARAYLRRDAHLLLEEERSTAGRFGAQITCSDLDSVRLAELLPQERIVSIPNGVDCDYFRPSAAPPRPGALAFIGTMNWYPNVDAMEYFLREIWPGLRSVAPHATLDIVGSNPPDSLVALAGRHAGVTVHGYVADVRPYIEQAAVLVCPIRDGGGTKLKVLDALASGKAMVAHPIACEGIDVRDGENIVLATEPGDWIAAIDRLLGDAAERERLGSAARALAVDRYSYGSIGARFRGLLEDVAATG